MTAYNVSITVSPNIFRAKVVDPDEFNQVSVFYDAMIRMIEDYNQVFEAKIIGTDEKKTPGGGGGIGVIKRQESISISSHRSREFVNQASVVI